MTMTIDGVGDGRKTTVCPTGSSRRNTRAQSAAMGHCRKSVCFYFRGSRRRVAQRRCAPTERRAEAALRDSEAQLQTFSGVNLIKEVPPSV